MESLDDFRTREIQLRTRQLTREIDRVVVGDGNLTHTELQMAVAVLAATMCEVIRRLAEKGGDAERALQQVIDLLQRRG